MTKLDEALGLFPSVIKCGEQWSSTCQAVLEAAKAELAELRAGPAQTAAPAAWLYEMAFYIKPSDQEPFKKWKLVATIEPPPTIPKDGVRNVSPLYTSVPSTVRVSPSHKLAEDCICNEEERRTCPACSVPSNLRGGE